MLFLCSFFRKDKPIFFCWGQSKALCADENHIFFFYYILLDPLLLYPCCLNRRAVMLFEIKGSLKAKSIPEVQSSAPSMVGQWPHL